jgi:hypothetical protein
MHPHCGSPKEQQSYTCSLHSPPDLRSESLGRVPEGWEEEKHGLIPGENSCKMEK